MSINAVAVVATSVLLAFTGGFVIRDITDSEPASSGGAAAVTTTEATVTTVSTAPPAEAPPATPPGTVPAGSRGFDEWMAVAEKLAPLTPPSDCGPPWHEAASLPNSGRDYRGGVHQGIDFICEERERIAAAALDGRVVQANDTFVDARPGERGPLLGIAQSLGRTPPWTLAFLFGRYVVLDHGIVPEVGHVVTIYAHFEKLHDDLRAGQAIGAGTPIGEIGNRGTAAGASGEDRPRSLHLHWEIHVDDEFLGVGLTYEQTRTVYQRLFAERGDGG